MNKKEDSLKGGLELINLKMSGCDKELYAIKHNEFLRKRLYSDKNKEEQ